MSLEEFKKIDAKNLPIGKLIAMIARSHNIYLNHNLEHFGINAAQLQLLFEIAHQSEINQEQIASRCNIDKGSVARTIKKLEDKNLIVRKVDDNNRRQNIISLTKNGEDTVRESINLLNIWEDKVFNDILVDREQLQHILKEVVIKTIELNQEESK